MDTSFLDNIVKVDFDSSQFIKNETKKRQIYLHHTGSGRGTSGDWRYWLSNSVRVATCVIIDYKGVINQLYSSKYWAYHLGVPGSTFKKYDLSYVNLNSISIGVEIDAWGPLAEIAGKYYSYTGKEVAKERVVSYDESFRIYPNCSYFESLGLIGESCYFYERYTDAQIQSTENLLKYWGQEDTYCISLHYNANMWDINKSALSGEEGIWAHVSVRSDKSDCHPQPELIQMLKGLSG